MCETCATLAARNEELEAEVANLKSELFGTRWEPPRALRMTRTETAILQAMVAAGDRYASREFLLDVRSTILAHVQSDPEPKIIDVMLSHMRAKLRRFDMTIEPLWGTGWRLSPDSRKRLLNWHVRQEAA